MKNRNFKNRKHVVTQFSTATIKKLKHHQLSVECAKLDKVIERGLADEGLLEDSKEWPKF